VRIVVSNVGLDFCRGLPDMLQGLDAVAPPLSREATSRFRWASRKFCRAAVISGFGSRPPPPRATPAAVPHSPLPQLRNCEPSTVLPHELKHAFLSIGTAA